MNITAKVLMPNWQRMRSSLSQQLDGFESGEGNSSFHHDKRSETIAHLKSMIVSLDGLLEDFGAASRLRRLGAIRPRERLFG